MSSKMVGIALTVRGVSPRAKLVLIAIADAADVHGVAFPSRKTLAEGADCSKDTVDRCVRELVDAELVKVTKRTDEERANRQTSNEYKLLFTPAADLRPGASDTGSDAAGGAADMPPPQPHSCAAPGAAYDAAPNMNGSRNGVAAAADAGARARSPAQVIVEAVNSPFLDPTKTPDLGMTSTEIGRWLAAGADLDLDVIPVVVALMARATKPIRKWGYFTEAVREHAARRIAPVQAIQPSTEPTHARPTTDFRARKRDGRASLVDVCSDLTREFEDVENRLRSEARIP